MRMRKIVIVMKKNYLWLGIIFFLSSFYFLFPYDTNQLLLFSKNESNNRITSAITTQFMHIDLVHLCINILTLGMITKQLQRSMKKITILIIYIFSLFFIGIMLILFGKREVTYLGNSGACIALFGFLLTLPSIDGNEKMERLSDLIGIIGFTFLFPNISWLMHLSGLCFGSCLGLITKYLHRIWNGY